jgi:hypothetical protein
MSATKPFAIDKWLVYEAYQAVKANAGSAGVDKESIGDFEKDLKGNLYKIWNRMSSGSYFPRTPRTQEITSSSNGRSPCIVAKQHLICVAGGNMLKAHVARHRFRKGTTGEQRLRSACSWSQPQRGRASIDRIIRVVASSGLSLPAGGAGTRAAAAGCPTDHSRHDQDPRRGRGGVARVCSRKRPDDGRDCRVRGIGVSGQGTPTWVIGAGRVMTCLWTMSLTACSPPSLSKSTRSWYRIGHAARGGRPG